MKNIKNLKKKIFGITLVVGLLVISIVSTTMAYFTDTDTKTNVFTSGNVEIDLNEDIFISQNVYPGQKIANGATVANTGSEDAYVGVIITLDPQAKKDLVLELFKDTDGDSTLGGTDYTVSYVEDGTNLTAIRIIYNNALVKGTSAAFFGQMNIPADWDNNEDVGNIEMRMFVDLNMTVKAYATQIVGFNDATEALEKAFPSIWGTTTNN